MGSSSHGYLFPIRETSQRKTWNRFTKGHFNEDRKGIWPSQDRSEHRDGVDFLEALPKTGSGKIYKMGGEIPKAIVVLKPGTKLTSQQIIDYSRGKLAHFKALREAEIIDEMPRRGTGKILKSTVRKEYG